MSTASDIEIIVSRLLLLSKEYTREEIDSMIEFDEFKTKNKLFYETILTEGIDLGIFKQMMKCKRKLEEGVDPYEVDVKFGKFMADKYVDPVIKNPLTKKI